MSTLGGKSIIVNTQSREDQQHIHNIIEDDKKTTKDCKHLDRSDRTDGGSKEGDGRCQRRQKHGSSSIGKGNGGDIFNRCLRIFQSSILPFVNSHKHVT